MTTHLKVNLMFVKSTVIFILMILKIMPTPILLTYKVL